MPGVTENESNHELPSLKSLQQCSRAVGWGWGGGIRRMYHQCAAPLCVCLRTRRVGEQLKRLWEEKNHPVAFDFRMRSIIFGMGASSNLTASPSRLNSDSQRSCQRFMFCPISLRIINEKLIESEKCAGWQPCRQKRHQGCPKGLRVCFLFL